jgi:hypothetical protein
MVSGRCQNIKEPRGSVCEEKKTDKVASDARKELRQLRRSVGLREGPPWIWFNNAERLLAHVQEHNP